MKRTREGKITSFFSPKSKLSTSDQPSASSITTFAQPSTSYLNTSDEPSISYFSTSDEGPSTSYVSTSDEGPSTSYVSTSDEGPSTSYVSISDEGPSTSYVSTFDEGPSTSYVSTFDEGPSTSYFSTFDEGPSTSYFSTSDEGPSTSYVSTSHEPSISYFSTSHAPSTCTSYIATSSASCISPSHQPSNSHACRLNEQCTSRKSKEALSHSIDSSLVHPKNVRQADRLKHKTGYLSSWETEYTWVYYCEGEGMYCKLCHKFSTRNRQNQSVVWNKEQWSTLTVARWPDASKNSHRASYITILVARRGKLNDGGPAIFSQLIPTRKHLHKLLIVVVNLPQPFTQPPPPPPPPP